MPKYAFLKKYCKNRRRFKSFKTPCLH